MPFRARAGQRCGIMFGLGKGAGRTAITIGDRFIRAGQPSKVFAVTRIDERPHHPPHARLTAITSTKEDITIAVNTLLDRRFFQPAPAESAEL